MPGIEICKEYRKAGGTALVLMLTGRTDANDIYDGLDAGADDYLRQALLHTRASGTSASAFKAVCKKTTEKVLKYGIVEFDPTTLIVKKSGVEVKLSKKEIALLTQFLKNPERVYSLDQLRALWTDSPDASEDTVRAHIKTLRKNSHR